MLLNFTGGLGLMGSGRTSEFIFSQVCEDNLINNFLFSKNIKIISKNNNNQYFLLYSGNIFIIINLYFYIFYNIFIFDSKQKPQYNLIYIYIYISQILDKFIGR